MKYVFLCEDSMEGIFTGVYDAWASGFGHENIELQVMPVMEPEFFCQYEQVTPDPDKSIKVWRSVLGKLGVGLHGAVCMAVYGDFSDKANAIYHTLVDYLSPKGAMYGKRPPSGIHPKGTGAHYLENMANPYTRRLFEIRRLVERERTHTLEFLRFREMTNRILFSKITPRHFILPLLEDHFAGRFPIERWMIYDAGRQMALAHEPGKGCMLMKTVQIKSEYLDHFADVEGDYEQLWWEFCDSIAIEARINPKLQRQLLPLKYRKNMVEFGRKH